MKLNQFAFDRICDQFNYYEKGLMTKKDALKQIAKIVSFELEVAEGMGYNQGHYDGSRDRVSEPDPNYISDSQLLTKGGMPTPKLVDYTDEHIWRDMLAAETRMTRNHND